MHVTAAAVRLIERTFRLDHCLLKSEQHIVVTEIRPPDYYLFNQD
jgi:hypothetical protein